LIKENIRENRAIKFHKEQLNVGSSVLHTLCKVGYGIPTKKFIAMACVNEAKIMLKHTSLTIEEIGYLLNFEDDNNFIRFFKTTTGMLLLKYREHLVQYSY